MYDRLWDEPVPGPPYVDLHRLLKGSGYDVLYRRDTVAEGVSLSPRIPKQW